MDQAAKRELFLKFSNKYFQEKITITNLIEHLKEIASLNADKIDLPENERAIFIANHPSADSTLTIPATNISGLKGGNSRNFPSFWFPIIRQALLKDAFGTHRFVTIANDIGWNVAMQEMWHFPITNVPGGRCNYIIESLRKDTDCSIVIFPEGKFNNMANFHSGFIHIAVALEIDYIITASFTPQLSLNTPNELKILKIERISDIVMATRKMVRKKRNEIIAGIQI